MISWKKQLETQAQVSFFAAKNVMRKTEYSTDSLSKVLNTERKGTISNFNSL